MSKVICTKEKIDDIADAIRDQLSSSDTYTLDDMPDAIASISGGGGTPGKVQISEFDFTSSTPYYDIIKEIELATNMKGLSNTQGVGLTATARGNRLRTGTNFDYAGIYEMEIKFGTFDRSTPPSDYTHSILLKVGRSSSYLYLDYYYNSSTQEGVWWIHDQSGNNIYLDGITDPYYFENKTLTMLYGAKYVNGEIVRDANKGYFYVNGVQLNSTGASIVGDVDSQIQVVFLCDSGNNAFIGAVYESLKIWQYFNKYSTPVSLMSMGSPSGLTVESPVEESDI